MLRSHLASFAISILIASSSDVGSRAADPAGEMPLPEKYVLDYPVAQQFCPPVESYWDDVSHAIQNINGRVIKHQYNGGFGLPVVDMVGDKHLLHLGADVSWHRPVAVYAIGNGVVRISTGGPTVAELAAALGKATPEGKSAGAQDDAKAPPAANAKATPAAAQRAKQQLGWGNLIVIEHKLPDGTYATSIYGHLANRRLVEAGDVVEAGQVIGTVAKSKLENGGYDSHLHFAVREGRMWEPGRELLTGRFGDKPAALKLVDLSERELQVELPDAVPDNFQMTVHKQSVACTTREGKHFLPAGVLNVFQPREFPIVGYGLTTDGFLDPTLFLQQMRADSLPAPFGRFPPQQVKSK